MHNILQLSIIGWFSNVWTRCGPERNEGRDFRSLPPKMIQKYKKLRVIMDFFYDKFDDIKIINLVLVCVCVCVLGTLFKSLCPSVRCYACVSDMTVFSLQSTCCETGMRSFDVFIDYPRLNLLWKTLGEWIWRSWRSVFVWSKRKLFL